MPAGEPGETRGPHGFLRALRRDWSTLWHAPEDRSAIVVLVTSLLLVIVFTLWAKPGFLKRHLDPVGSWVGLPPDDAYHAMLPYVYWAVTSVVLRVLVPLAIVVWVLHRRPGDFGYRLRGVTRHAWLYLVMFLAMIPLVTAASFTPAFQAKYPLFFPAAGWTQFLLYQLAYGLQFVGVEAFFRGYMTFGLYPRFGYQAVFIMVIPYTMVHFGKPPLEVFMAIPAGLLLGYLALKTRSWVFGALLHWSVAITMDLLAIIHRGGLGQSTG